MVKKVFIVKPGEFMMIGGGYTKPEKSRSEHNKGTAVEVILGAMYLDNGLEAVKIFIKGWE